MIDRIIHDMYVLSSVEFSGRLSGTEGARKAANFLASSLQSAGFLPARELRIRRSLAQEIANQEGLLVTIELPLEMATLPCQTVLGILPGVDTKYTLALTAHYDHLDDDPQGVRFPGTIDNSSGVAVTLEVARMLA